MFRRIKLSGMCAILSICGVFSSPAIAAEPASWPQFRGHGDAVSTETDLLRVWPEDGPPIEWRRPLGTGFSGIVVDAERFYTLYADDETTFLAAFRADDGAEIWRRPLGESFRDEFGAGPRSTPFLDGDAVFALSARGKLLAARAEDGATIWEKDLFAVWPAIDIAVETGGEGDPQVQMPNFGYAASPIVVDDLVIVVTGAGPGKFVTALDRRTGERIWSALDGVFHYATPVLTEIAGRRQLIVQTVSELVGLDLRGEVLWRFPWHALVAPVALPPDQVFISAAMGDVQGARALSFHADEDGTLSVESTWESREMRNFWNASVAYEGRLYGFDSATFKCLDAATAQRCWAKRGLGKGSLIAADGRLIVFSDRGVLAMIDADPAEYRELGRMRVFEQAARTWTPPALADGRLYLRDPTGELVRLDLRAGSEEAAVVEDNVEAGRTLPTKPRTSLTADALTPDQALDRAIQALGGQERWDAVHAMSVECRFSTFSQERPCRIERLRPNSYRFEYFFASFDMVHAYDGTSTWWINRSPYGDTPEATAAPEAVARELVVDSDFGGTLLEARARDHRAVAVVAGEIVGDTTWELKILRGDDIEEIWHLDPQTWLPRARISPGAFRELARRKISFFEDYRDVDGLKIPFRVEIELEERFQVLDIDSVELGGEVDPALFRAPFKAPDSEE